MKNDVDEKEAKLGWESGIDKVMSSQGHCNISANQKRRKKRQRIVLLLIGSVGLSAIAIGTPLAFILSGNQSPSVTEVAKLTRYYQSYAEMESSYEKLFSDYCKYSGKDEETMPEFFHLNYEECLSSKAGTLAHYISGLTYEYCQEVGKEKIFPTEVGFGAGFGPPIFDVNGKRIKINEYICVNFFKKKIDISTPSLEWDDSSSFSNEEGDSVYENFGPNSLWPRGGITGWSAEVRHYLVDRETNQAIISLDYPFLPDQPGGSYISEKSLLEFEAAISDIMDFLKEQTAFLLIKEQQQ